MTEIYDLIIYGGSIGGCITAAVAAEKGYKVAIVEKKTFLGDLLTSSLMADCGNKGSASIKKELLDDMTAHGVDVLFMSDITALAVMGESAVGVVISNRFGQQIVYSKSVIDASGFCRAVEMADNVNLWEYNGKCKFYLKYSGDYLPSDGTYSIPQNENIGVNTVKLLNTYDGCKLAEFEFDVAAGSDRYSDIMAWNTAAIEIADKIDSSMTMFNDLRIIQSSYEVCLTDLPQQTIYSNRLGNIAALYLSVSSYDELTKEKTAAYKQTAKEVIEHLKLCENSRKFTEIISRNIVIPTEKCLLSTFYDHKLDFYCETLKFDYAEILPCIDKTSVLVAGGGTGGISAAVAAASECKDVIIIDENPGFGGTQTFGSVCRYYHGYVKGFALNQEEKIHKSSPVYKRFLYKKEANENNIKQYESVSVCGAVYDEKEIKGVVIANSDIWGVIKADVTVDGTGDADIFAFCGLKTYEGSYRDGNMQDFSQSVIERAGLDLDVINHNRYSEILRGIKLAHTQHKLGDFSAMLTPRSTRCFEGEYTITLKDVLCEKRYDDVIAMASTDSDAHGALSSLIQYMGFMPYHDRIFLLQVPLGACKAKKLGRLYAAGKSISATPDAAPLFRMSADVINRGYAVGIAAAEEAKGGSVDYVKLKEKLVKVWILPEKQPEKYKADGEEFSLLQTLCMDKTEAIDKLKTEYRKTGSDNSAVALAWFGCDDGASRLIKRLSELLEKEKKEVYSDIHPFKPGNNKGGVIGKPETYWQINRIITALAILKEAGCKEQIFAAIKAFNGGGSSVRDDNEYIYGRIDLQRLPHFDRIRILCFYVESCPDKMFIEPLEELLTKKGFGGYVSKENVIGRNYQNAYIELTISRALARCGSDYGIKSLVDFLEDIHYNLSENAHNELAEISGEDYGYDKEKWHEWLKKRFNGEVTNKLPEITMF